MSGSICTFLYWMSTSIDRCFSLLISAHVLECSVALWLEVHGDVEEWEQLLGKEIYYV